MYQIVEQTEKEKFKMYSKLSKKELISMLIETNKHLNNKPINYTKSVTIIGDLCSCNPANGGSGICGCTIANNPINFNDYDSKTNFIINPQIT